MESGVRVLTVKDLIPVTHEELQNVSTEQFRNRGPGKKGMTAYTVTVGGDLWVVMHDDVTEGVYFTRELVEI